MDDLRQTKRDGRFGRSFANRAFGLAFLCACWRSLQLDSVLPSGTNDWFGWITADNLRLVYSRGRDFGFHRPYGRASVGRGGSFLDGRRLYGPVVFTFLRRRLPSAVSFSTTGRGTTAFSSCVISFTFLLPAVSLRHFVSLTVSSFSLTSVGSWPTWTFGHSGRRFLSRRRTFSSVWFLRLFDLPTIPSFSLVPGQFGPSYSRQTSILVLPNISYTVDTFWFTISVGISFYHGDSTTIPSAFLDWFLHFISTVSISVVGWTTTSVVCVWPGHAGHAILWIPWFSLQPCSALYFAFSFPADGCPSSISSLVSAFSCRVVLHYDSLRFLDLSIPFSPDSFLPGRVFSPAPDSDSILPSIAAVCVWAALNGRTGGSGST